MNLKRKTLIKEQYVQHILSILGIRYEYKNACSYLLYLPQGRVMLFTGKSGVKINAIDRMSCSKKAIEDFRQKISKAIDTLEDLQK